VGVIKKRRYAQCRWKKSGLLKLAHLLATHSSATPKQAKEPSNPMTNQFISSMD
jgi:hypothetical protein